jgi:hypothetical protein
VEESGSSQEEFEDSVAESEGWMRESEDWTEPLNVRTPSQNLWTVK